MGGRSTKFGLLDDSFRISTTRESTIGSIDELVVGILDLCAHPKIVAISVPGPVDYVNQKVISCLFLPWLEGDLPHELKRIMGQDVSIILFNDGDAHTLSLNGRKDVELGALSISLGASIGFGALDANGTLFRPLSGNNWEIGHITIPDSPFDEFDYSSKAGYLLGSNGFEALKIKFGDKAYEVYGCFLGKFVANLCIIFQPRTVFFTGGMVRYDWNKISSFVKRAISLEKEHLSPPKIVASKEFDSALSGLANAVKKEYFGKI